MNSEDSRPNPDELLKNIKSEETSQKGKLKIFLGYAAGVGKTYAMLDEAIEQYKSGKDVLVGYVEPHTRPETLALLEGLPSLPPLKVSYKNMNLIDFDLQEAINRKPDIILVDELAHTNAPGMRNKKRYQDIEELLNNGIDVYTTVNIQHIESLNDVVEDLTHIIVRETVPNFIFDTADKIKLVDIEPEELLLRLKNGKIYKANRAKSAMSNFFTIDKLRLLRELALRKATERVSYTNWVESTEKESRLSEKFLVCISASPSSAKCIRWTARTAASLHSEWLALYIETSDSATFNQKQTDMLKYNLSLAANLGAKIVTMNGDNVADIICEYVRITGISNIVIGKSKTSKISRLYKDSLEDVLAANIEHAELHIVVDNAVKGKKPIGELKLKSGFEFSVMDTIKMIVLLAAATLLCSFLVKWNISDTNSIMVYILAVVIISRITSGFLYGIVSAFSSVLLFNFFFVPPIFSFSAYGTSAPITFIIMFILAIITSTMINRVKSHAKQSATREKRTEILYEINKKLLVTRGLNNIVDLITDYITNYFNTSVIFYFDDPQTENSYKLRLLNGDDDYLLANKKEQATASWVYINKKRAGFETDTLSNAAAHYMPLYSENTVYGVIGISKTACEQLDHDSRYFLRMISSLAVLAFERQKLSDEQSKTVLEHEKETMRSNLLRAISHDLRSPLTSIMGASSVLLEDNDGQLSTQTRQSLLMDINHDSSWLIRMVENLLAVTKIDQGTVTINKTDEAVEEIVGEAVSRIANKYPNIKININIPNDLLLVPMDGTLIEQVLINLLENAAKYSGGSQINLDIFERDNVAVFEMSDNGKGVPVDELTHLFDGYRKTHPDSSRGLGIGLSICKSIVEAHGGRIYAKNDENGAVFTFELPIKEGDML